MIESKKLSFTSAGNEFNVRLPYRVITFDEPAVKISKQEYIRQMFTPTSSMFNGFSGYTPDVLSGYVLPVGANAEQKTMYSYLISHLSNDKGVVGFETSLGQDDGEQATVWYVDTLTTPENIFGYVNADTLLFHYSDGRTGKVANPFRFPEPGVVKKVETGLRPASTIIYTGFLWSLLFLFFFSGVCLDDGILNLTRHLRVLGKLHRIHCAASGEGT